MPGDVSTTRRKEGLSAPASTTSRCQSAASASGPPGRPTMSSNRSVGIVPPVYQESPEPRTAARHARAPHDGPETRRDLRHPFAAPAGVGDAAGVPSGFLDGAIQTATTYETTTATMTTGMTATASERKSRLGRSTAVMGIFNAPATMAPTPMAAPATTGSPPTWERAMPPAAPMNMLGKIGPPRNPLSEMA